MSTFIIVGIGLCAAVIVLVFILARVVMPRRRLPYLRVDSLLSPAERSFYGVLRHAIGEQYEVMCKVRLIDLLWLPKGTPDRQAHINRIIAKHVDFVLCSRSDFSPQLVSELDDSSHQRRNRQERDAFLGAALNAAAINLLRVEAKAQYSPHEVRSLVISSIAPDEAGIAGRAP